MLVSEIEKAGGIDPEMPVLLDYTGLSQEPLEKFIADSADLWQGQPNTTVIGSVIGTHAGPGAVAAAFFCNKN